LDAEEVAVTTEPAERTDSVSMTVVMTAPFTPVEVTVACTEVVRGAVSVLLSVETALVLLESPLLEMELPVLEDDPVVDVSEEDEEVVNVGEVEEVVVLDEVEVEVEVVLVLVLVLVLVVLDLVEVVDDEVVVELEEPVEAADVESAPAVSALAAAESMDAILFSSLVR